MRQPRMLPFAFAASLSLGHQQKGMRCCTIPDEQFMLGRQARGWFPWDSPGAGNGIAGAACGTNAKERSLMFCQRTKVVPL